MKLTSNLNYVYVSYGRDSVAGRLDDFAVGAWCAAALFATSALSFFY